MIDWIGNIAIVLQTGKDWMSNDFISDIILRKISNKKMLQFCQKFISILPKKSVRILSKNWKNFDKN
jgi:hypothetical protein